MKKSYITNSTVDSKYVVAFEVVNEIIWLQKFLLRLGIVSLVVSSLVLFCYNSKVVA